MLRCAVPEMPLKAKVPITVNRVVRTNYMVEAPVVPHIWRMWYERGVPDWLVQRRERAQERKGCQRRGRFSKAFLQAKAYRHTEEVRELMKASEALEAPNDEFHHLVFAPRDTSEVSLDPGQLQL